MKRQLIFLGLIGSPGLALCVAAVTLAMVFALDSDVEVLSKRTRAAARAEKSLRADVEAIRNDLAALSSEAAAADSSPAPAPVAAATAPAASGAPNPIILTRAPHAIDSPRPLALNAAIAPAALPAECVFRPGEAERLADCIRSQQDRIGGRRGPSSYR